MNPTDLHLRRALQIEEEALTAIEQYNRFFRRFGQKTGGLVALFNGILEDERRHVLLLRDTIARREASGQTEKSS
jgi:hypothetical protein